MNWPDILVRPRSDLAWSFSFEELLRREVERTIQDVVGRWAFNTKSWTELGAVVQAKQTDMVNKIQALVPEKERKRGTVYDVQIVMLHGQSGPPPHPEAPRMHASFGAPWTYNKTLRGAHALLEPVGLLWVDRFAHITLQEDISVVEAEARRRGDTYILELDKITTCKQDSGKPPCWESQVVMVSIQKRRPLVVTLSFSGYSDDGLLEISCSNIGGNILANDSVDPRTTCVAFRTSLAKALGLENNGLKIVSPSGGPLSRKWDSLPLADFLFGQKTCFNRLEQPHGHMIKPLRISSSIHL